MSDDLQVFTPVPRTVRVGGRVVEVLPLRLRHYAAFTRAIEPALPVLMSGDLYRACLEHNDALLRAVSIATGVPEPELAELWTDEFLRLLRAVVVVNGDFFLHRVLPEVQGAVEEIAQLIGTAGAPSSPGSDAAGSA
jgi:hypothetical protein